MTAFQRLVIRELFTRSTRLHFAGRWILAGDVREDKRLAELIYWTLLA